MNFLIVSQLEGEPLKPLDSDFFKDATKIETDSYMSKESASLSFQYDGKRTVSYRLKLKPGVYCIVPNALKDHEEGEFLLRVFSDNKSTVEWVLRYLMKWKSPTLLKAVTLIQNWQYLQKLFQCLFTESMTKSLSLQEQNTSIRYMYNITYQNIINDN